MILVQYLPQVHMDSETSSYCYLLLGHYMPPLQCKILGYHKVQSSLQIRRDCDRKKDDLAVSIRTKSY